MPVNGAKDGRPFKKGQSGNPKGRPKKLPDLEVIMAAVLADESGGITAAEQIIKALHKAAIKGNVRAAELLLDRAYGKITQKIDHTTGGEKFNGFDFLSPIAAPDDSNNLDT